ncbi:MAG: extracellular solute-binding protein [Firmicutes bacterium]|nr:extracellular solute-binding protein [Bacillota bacterium]
MKKLFLVFLMVALAAPAPGAWADGAADEALPYGETIIAVPDGYGPVVSMAVAPDGSVIAAARHASGAWHLLSWQDLAAEPGVTAIAYDGADDISALGIAPDGQIMAVIAHARAMLSGMPGQDAGPGPAANSVQPAEGAPASDVGTPSGLSNRSMGGGRGLASTVLWLSPDGAVTASFEISGVQAQTLALSGRRMASYQSFQTGVSIYDDTGSEAARISAGEAQAMAASDTALYVLAMDGIHTYGLEDGQSKGSVPVALGYGGLAALSPDGTLYFTDMDGVNRVDFNGRQAKRVMNFTGTLMGDPGNGITGFGVREDGTIVALTGSGGMGAGAGGTFRMTAGRAGGGNGSDNESTLSYYVPMDPSIAANRAVFTITTLYSATTLRKAASDFQRGHPELTVVLQAQIGDGNESSVEDHIRTLNTDLLAGRGGDVLILDGLPMDQYIRRGILADLSALLPKLDLLPNIIEGSADAGGKVFAVPAKYSFETLWGNAALLAQIASLEDLAYANLAPGQAPLAARTPEEWLRLMYPVCEASLKGADGQLHFDTPAFELFLETLYDLYTAQGELTTLDVSRQFGRGGSRVGGGRVNMEEMLSVYNGAVAFFPATISSLQRLSTAYTVSGKEDGAFMTMPSLDGPSFTYTPALLAGINARSSQRALAEEFVALLFSPQVQEADQMSNLPTTAGALDKLFGEALEQAADSGVFTAARMMIPGGVSLDIGQPTAEVWDALRSLCETVTVPTALDETLLSFIVEETKNFFDGQISAPAAATALERRAWFYLNE